jgi:hypothetical protein
VESAAELQHYVKIPCSLLESRIPTPTWTTSGEEAANTQTQHDDDSFHYMSSVSYLVERNFFWGEREKPANLHKFIIVRYAKLLAASVNSFLLRREGKTQKVSRKNMKGKRKLLPTTQNVARKLIICVEV